MEVLQQETGHLVGEDLDGHGLHAVPGRLVHLPRALKLTNQFCNSSPSKRLTRLAKEGPQTTSCVTLMQSPQVLAPTNSPEETQMPTCSTSQEEEMKQGCQNRRTLADAPEPSSHSVPSARRSITSSSGSISQSEASPGSVRLRLLRLASMSASCGRVRRCELTASAGSPYDSVQATSR